MGADLVSNFPVHPTHQIITINNFAQILEGSKKLQTSHHSGYGQLHKIQLTNQIVYVGESKTGIPPTAQCLHWLVYPSKVVVVPPYIKLEDTEICKYSRMKGRREEVSTVNIIEWIYDVSQFCLEKNIGLSKNRIGFGSKWGIIGENVNNGIWNYHQFYRDKVNEFQHIYLSPQLMQSLSKQKLYPKININQSDVFIFAIMILEIITHQPLQKQIYNYKNLEIKLKPIIKCLAKVENMFGNFIYSILIQMLQMNPKHRISFYQILQLIPSYFIKSRSSNISSKLNEGQKFSHSFRQIERSPGSIRKNIKSAVGQKKRKGLMHDGQSNILHQKMRYGGTKGRGRSWRTKLDRK